MKKLNCSIDRKCKPIKKLFEVFSIVYRCVLITIRYVIISGSVFDLYFFGMAQYLLLSFQLEENKQLSKSDIERIIGSMGEVFNFPDASEDNSETSKLKFNFSSTDQLIGLTDDIAKLDATAFGLLTRVSRSIHDLCRKVDSDQAKGWNDLLIDFEPPKAEKPKASVLVQVENKDEEYSINKYIEKWCWNSFQFSKENSVINIYQTLLNEIQSSDEVIRTCGTAFTEAGNKLNALRRRNEGSLLVRNLDEIGSKMFSVKTLEDYITAKSSDKKAIYVCTRNLQTILVVVKNSLVNDFKDNYATEYIVPNSITEIEHDNEFTCFSVTLTRTNLDDYKYVAKSHGWHIRDFKYNENMREEIQRESREVIQNYIEECNRYAGTLESTFSQLAIFWMHIKAVRTFIESVLIYGIKSKFQTFEIKALPKNIPKIHKELEKVFGDGNQEQDDDFGDEGDDEYHSYVSFKLNVVGLS